METEEEKTIPKEALKDVLNAYDKLYQCNVAALNTFDFKMEQAEKSLTSLIVLAINITLIILSYFGCVCSLNFDNYFLKIIVWLVCLIVLGISFLYFVLSLFYLQDVPGEKRKLRFRPIYNFRCLIRDFKEIKQFKKKFNIKVSTLAFIYGRINAKKEAYESLCRQAYAHCPDYVNLINEYKDKYSSYKDYANLDEQWNICGQLLRIINSGRADNLKEALASFDVSKGNQRDEVKSRIVFTRLAR